MISLLYLTDKANKDLIPDEKGISEADGILKALKLDTVYARVDMVKWKGKFHLMELEVIEPKLYFGFSDQAMLKFAKAVSRKCV